MAHIGELIQELRKDRGWNQQDLAERLCVDSSLVSRMERGVTKNVGHGMVVKLSEVFGVSTDYLLGRTKVSEPNNYEISSLGLSEKVVKRLITGEIDADILNRILEHEDFPKLLRQAGFYFNKDTASVFEARNKAIEQAVQSVREIGAATEANHADVVQTVNHLNAARIPVDEPDLRIIRSGLMKILRDIRTDIQHDTPMSVAVTEEVFDALRGDMVVSQTAPSVETFWHILENHVDSSQFTPEMQELTMQYFRRLWELAQDAFSEQEVAE